MTDDAGWGSTAQSAVLLASQASRLILIIVYKNNRKGLTMKRDQVEHT